MLISLFLTFTTMLESYLPRVEGAVLSEERKQRTMSVKPMCGSSTTQIAPLTKTVSILGTIQSMFISCLRMLVYENTYSVTWILVE